MKKIISIILIALALAGCGGTDKDDDEECNDPTGCDGQNPIVAINLHFGRGEKGPYPKDTPVSVTAYDSSWNQTDFPKEGNTEENDGSYQISGSVTSSFVKTEIDGDSYNEVFDRYDQAWLRDMDVNDGTAKNLNPLTTVQYMVGFDHCKDPSHPYFEQTEYCIALAKSEILSFLNFTDYGTSFNKTSLQGNTIPDAQMALFSFYIAKFDFQNDQMRVVANGIINNDLTLKQSIQDDFNSMLFVNTRKNLQNKYTELGLGALFPPVEKLPFVPSYYDDIWNGNHQLIEQTNAAGSYQCTIDVNDRTDFAYPMEFASLTEAAYYASELKGNQSLWSTAVCDNGVTTFTCPGTNLLQIEKLREVLLDNSEFNGRIPANDLNNGQYFLVEHYETGTAPSHECNGEMVPFGKNLATIDGNWNNAIGYNNASRWFVRRPDVDLWD